MGHAIAEGSLLPMYTDVHTLENAAIEHRHAGLGLSAIERNLGLLPVQPSRLVVLLRRIGAVRPAPVQAEYPAHPSYRPAKRLMPAH